MTAKKDMTQEEIKANVLARMRRIEGQVRGIQKMIEDGKECADILVQVRAVKSALHATTRLILRRYLLRCAEEPAGADPAARFEKAVKVLSDFIDD
jgi:DNA-binding FrmR family transcriptional regulator